MRSNSSSLYPSPRPLPDAAIFALAFLSGAAFPTLRLEFLWFGRLLRTGRGDPEVLLPGGEIGARIPRALRECRIVFRVGVTPNP